MHSEESNAIKTARSPSRCESFAVTAVLFAFRSGFISRAYDAISQALQLLALSVLHATCRSLNDGQRMFYDARTRFSLR